MDDPAIFLNYIINICNVQLLRVRNEMIAFKPTFCTLMNTPEQQLDEFIKNTHSANSAQTANQRILIRSGTVIFLKSIRFKLVDRQKCNALPNEVQLATITEPDMEVFRQQRSQFIELENQRKQNTLPEVTVPKFDGKNYDDFTAQFNEVVTRTYRTYGSPIDYLLQ